MHTKVKTVQPRLDDELDRYVHQLWQGVDRALTPTDDAQKLRRRMADAIPEVHEGCEQVEMGVWRMLDTHY